MVVTDDMLNFLKLSQRLMGTNLLLTDMEKTIIEIDSDGNVDLTGKRISDALKNSGITETTIKNGNDVIQLFENEIAINTETIALICNQGKQIGFLVYHDPTGEFFYKDIEFADTAKYFIERFADMQYGTGEE